MTAGETLGSAKTEHRRGQARRAGKQCRSEHEESRNGKFQMVVRLWCVYRVVQSGTWLIGNGIWPGWRRH